MRKWITLVEEVAASRANPTARKLISMVERSRDGKLRGLVSMNGDLYWWDAYDATHDQAARELGIEYWPNGKDNRLFASRDRGGIVVDHGNDMFAPALRRLAMSAEGTDMMFSGWLGTWSPEEYIEQLNDIET